jgi:hypothetical protein
MFSSVARVGCLAPVVVALAATIILVACGDGESPTDESYVEALCGAGNRLIDEFTSGELPDLLARASEDPAARDEAFALLAGIYRRFAEQMRDMNPPADIRQHHDRIVESMEQLVASLEAGNEDAFDAFDDAIAFPPDIAERLMIAALDVEECQRGINIFEP